MEYTCHTHVTMGPLRMRWMTYLHFKLHFHSSAHVLRSLYGPHTPLRWDASIYFSKSAFSNNPFYIKVVSGSLDLLEGDVAAIASGTRVLLCEFFRTCGENEGWVRGNLMPIPKSKCTEVEFLPHPYTPLAYHACPQKSARGCMHELGDTTY